MLYVDSSAFAKRYLADEDDNLACIATMDAAHEWATSRITLVETVRTLSHALPPLAAREAIIEFDAEALDSILIDIDRATLAIAREVAASTGAKTLDAIHLASALRVADGDLSVLTFDRKQAAAAEQLGLRLAPLAS